MSLFRPFNLFIDDERFPPDDLRRWEVVRSVEEARDLIERMGRLPDYISFDHDLGDDVPTGFDLTKLLVDMDLDGTYRFRAGFCYYVHSQNPTGKANIEGLLKGYMRHKDN